jgi:hypothetical protein
VEPDVGFLIHAEPTASFIHLQRSANGGVTWSRTIELPEAGPLADVDFVDGEDGWLAGSAGRGRGVWRTLDAGRTWQRIRAPLPSACRHFDVRSFHVPSFFGDEGVLPLTCRSDRRWLIGFDVSRDGGRTWHVASATSIRMETRNGWPAFAVAGAGTWWTGAGGTVRITFDGGGSWRQVPTPPDTRVDTIAPVEGDSAWLVATRGRHTTLLFRTDDGGRSWRRVRPETATGRARPLGDLWYGRIPFVADGLPGFRDVRANVRGHDDRRGPDAMAASRDVAASEEPPARPLPRVAPRDVHAPAVGGTPGLRVGHRRLRRAPWGSDALLPRAAPRVQVLGRPVDAPFSASASLRPPGTSASPSP